MPSTMTACSIGEFTSSMMDEMVPEVVLPPADMTIEKCKEFCSKYKFYGVQAGDECHCGDSDYNFVPSPETECDTSCKGNASQKCGGTWRMNVYDSFSSEGSDLVGPSILEPKPFNPLPEKKIKFPREEDIIYSDTDDVLVLYNFRRTSDQDILLVDQSHFKCCIALLSLSLNEKIDSKTKIWKEAKNGLKLSSSTSLF